MVRKSGRAASLKQRMAKGERIVGVLLDFSYDRAGLERVLAKGSYDLVWTDGQHTPLNEERLAAFCATAQELDIPVVFRIKPTPHTYMAGPYLDMGCSGIMVPDVVDEATVDEAIARFYYPPLGRRHWGGEGRVGSAERSGRIEYARWWNEYGILWLQLESVEGVINARRFAKKGVDCISFGAADLSFSLESHPHFPVRTVDECVPLVASQLKGTGVVLGFTSAVPEERDRYARMGVTVHLERPLV